MSDLLYKKKNTFEEKDDAFINKAYDYCEGYKAFLDSSYIERPGIESVKKEAEEKGYLPFDFKKTYVAGDKFYHIQKERSMLLVSVGKDDIENGFNMVAAHIDCPRLDLKPSPLFDDSGIAYFKTHYYGGIKKYQWVTIPLLLCGRVYKKDGTAVDIVVGKDRSDPVFYISDLLPHLAREQESKSLYSGISGEDLKVIIGTRHNKKAENDDKKTDGEDSPRYFAMKLLNEKYGITEEDLFSAELSFVPNYEPRDVGFDRSLIASAGHDDRICCYPAVSALFEETVPERTSVVLLADKEEIGSVGITGMQGNFWYDILSATAENAGKNKYIMFENSTALSADVAAAYDPSYSGVYDKGNSADINCGFALYKYSGAGGKSNASEADPKFMAELRNLFDKKELEYQFYELGKIDAGGGGTVSKYIAAKNISVVDMGVPILSMHAPYEAAAKTDIYNMYLAVKAYLEEFR